MHRPQGKALRSDRPRKRTLTQSLPRSRIARSPTGRKARRERSLRHRQGKITRSHIDLLRGERDRLRRGGAQEKEHPHNLGIEKSEGASHRRKKGHESAPHPEGLQGRGESAGSLAETALFRGHLGEEADLVTEGADHVHLWRS